MDTQDTEAERFSMDRRSGGLGLPDVNYQTTRPGLDYHVDLKDSTQFNLKVPWHEKNNFMSFFVTLI